MSNPIILYDNLLIGATLTLPFITPPTEAGYSLENLKDYRPYTWWRAGNSGTQFQLKIDLGIAKTVNSFGIIGHNLGTEGAKIQLYSSPDDNVYTGRSVEIEPTDDGVLFDSFGDIPHRYWMLFISKASDFTPQMAVVFIGQKLEMPYPPEAPYTPISKSIITHTARSKTGQLLGSSVRFKPIEIDATFRNLDASFVEGAYRTFWETHASEFLPFFWHYLDQTYYVALKQEAVFSAPRNMSLYVSEIQLPMTGLDNI